MDLAGWRDIAVVIIGITSAIVAILAAGIFGAIWWFGRKGFKAVDALLNDKVRPALDTAELQLLTIRDQTARLPGSAAIGLGEAPVAKKGGFPIPLPFRKKKRRFPLLPS